MSWEPKILQNRPFNNAYGQYNYGNLLEGERTTLLGTLGFSYGAPETDLNTMIYDKVLSPHPNGQMYFGNGSEIAISHIKLQDRGRDTDDGKWMNFRVGVYIFDDRVHPDIITADSGNKIRDVIGTGNSFTKMPWRRAYWNKGELPTDSQWGGSDTGDIEAVSAGSWGEAKQGSKLIIAKSFPFLEDMSVFDKDIQSFTDDVTGNLNNAEDSSYYVVIRVQCDEREYLLTKGHRTDELNMVYGVCRIRKKTLYKLFLEAKGETVTLQYHMDGIDDKSGDYKIHQREDDHGNSRGWSKKLFGEYLTDNDKARNWNIKRVDIKITGPDWSPQEANKPLALGGGDSGWFEKSDEYNYGWHAVKTGGAKPSVFDYYGHPETSYYLPDETSHYQTGVKGSTNKKFFKSADIIDFRPIVTTTTGEPEYDLQNYVNPYYPMYPFITAPNEVQLKVDIADINNNFSPKYLDLQDEKYDNIDFYFYVVNWDWQEGDTPETTDAGGGVCEQETSLIDCITELGEQFPENYEDLEMLSLENDTYVRGNVRNNDVVSHGYAEPGIYTIKTIVIATQKNQHFGDINSNYSQVVRWKLASTKINLATDISLTADFEDVGSDGFSFLPYPTTEPLTINGEPSLAPSGNPYYKSHAIVGGISNESVYVESLKVLKRADKFGQQELADKGLMFKSLENLPGGIMDEFGEHLGQIDVNQVRGFTKPFSMWEFLNIQPAISQTEFHGIDDIEYWDGNTPTRSFPKESSVGDIFIDDWDNYFADECVIEINPSELYGKSMRDSSGNGNVGVLLGDFSVKKDKVGKPVSRDSFVDVPKIDNKDGAF
tara:strand:+ start:378 stop:2852 length:2475 start_codon:yes stop_codon:yes gene_type:complete